MGLAGARRHHHRPTPRASRVLAHLAASRMTRRGCQGSPRVKFAALRMIPMVASTSAISPARTSTGTVPGRRGRIAARERRGSPRLRPGDGSAPRTVHPTCPQPRPPANAFQVAGPGSAFPAFQELSSRVKKAYRGPSTLDSSWEFSLARPAKGCLSAGTQIRVLPAPDSSVGALIDSAAPLRTVAVATSGRIMSRKAVGPCGVRHCGRWTSFRAWSLPVSPLRAVTVRPRPLQPPSPSPHRRAVPSTR